MDAPDSDSPLRNEQGRAYRCWKRDALLAMVAAFLLFLLAGGLVFLRAKTRAGWAKAEAQLEAELKRLANEHIQQRLK